MRKKNKKIIIMIWSFSFRINIYNNIRNIVENNIYDNYVFMYNIAF